MLAEIIYANHGSTRNKTNLTRSLEHSKIWSRSPRPPTGDRDRMRAVLDPYQIGPICDLPSVNDNCGDIPSKQTLLVDSEQMLRPCHSLAAIEHRHR